MQQVLVAGGGPAGAAAAISARMEGSSVRLFERATTARHKVCGEFISPGARGCLDALGVWAEFSALGPSRLRRCRLRVGNQAKQWTLAEPGWGLSRLQLDRLLLGEAARIGVEVVRGETIESRDEHLRATPLILACGRKPAAARGDRLFGFKAHFEGPADDAVELFFDASGYVGVSSIEDGLTNVCGIAPESTLKKFGFQFDEVVRRSRALAERLEPLRRQMSWIAAGPICYSSPSRSGPDHVYAVGDSLGFVDPFTGSGILNGLITGRLAGVAAARHIPSAEYLLQCKALLQQPFFISSLLRRAVVQTGFTWLARFLPGELLFRWTRANLDPAAETWGQTIWSGVST